MIDPIDNDQTSAKSDELKKANDQIEILTMAGFGAAFLILIVVICSVTICCYRKRQSGELDSSFKNKV